MHRSLTALLVLVAFAPAALAQTPDWNRKISDVRIVHPPGTPPGTYRVQAALNVYLSDLAPQPADLSLDLNLRINGMPFVTEGVVVTPLAAPIQCFFSCNNPNCMQLSLTSVSGGAVAIDSGVCYDPPGPTYACSCWMIDHWWWFYTDLVVNPSDLIEVEISARAGALPELDTTDDVIGFHVWEQAPGVAFCSGDGSGAACPCGNNGAAGNGCASSVQSAGANLEATGNGSVSGDSVVLWGTGMPNSSVLYFQGTTQFNAGAGAAFGDGLRCAGGSVIRLGSKVNVAGASHYPDVGDPLVSVRGAVNPAGATHTYQAWYRNAAAFCTPSTFNLTNGVSIAWQP